jgi:hypothetical protein
MLAGEPVQSNSELLITFGGFAEVKRFGGGPFLLIEKGNVMRIAGGIDTDSEMHDGRVVVVHDNLRQVWKKQSGCHEIPPRVL